MERSSRKIAIVAAMSEELAPFRDFYKPEVFYQNGKCLIEKALINNVTIFIVESGIGKVNAAFSATLLCEKVMPDLIINTGSAGGFPNQVAVGDVVIAKKVTYGDVDATAFNYADGQVPQMPPFYLCDDSFDFLIKDSFLDYHIHQGLVLTSDSFMSNRERVFEIQSRFKKALASDMEGTAIAQVAKFFEVPFLNIRGISDIAGQSAAKTFDEKLTTAAYHAFIEVKKICDTFN